MRKVMRADLDSTASVDEAVIEGEASLAEDFDVLEGDVLGVIAHGGIELWHDVARHAIHVRVYEQKVVRVDHLKRDGVGAFRFFFFRLQVVDGPVCGVVEANFTLHVVFVRELIDNAGCGRVFDDDAGLRGSGMRPEVAKDATTAVVNPEARVLRVDLDLYALRRGRRGGAEEAAGLVVTSNKLRVVEQGLRTGEPFDAGG